MCCTLNTTWRVYMCNEHFHSPQLIAQPSKKYVSSICTACGCVWVSTVGSGIFVYSPSTKAPVAVWGQQEKQKIFTLLYIEESYTMLALTLKGIVVFEANTQWESTNVSSCSILVPTHSFSLTGETINLGAVIPPGPDMDSSEIWLCSQNGHTFSILDAEKFGTKEKAAMFDRADGGHKFRHLQPVVLDGRSFLVATDRYLVQKWDVLSRQRLEQFNCHEHCRSVTGDNGTSVMSSC